MSRVTSPPIPSYLIVDHLYGGSHAPRLLPRPLNPQSLPQGQAGRHAFLLGVLPTYLGPEERFDKDYAVHGQNHVMRSFIFATARANILAESGVSVARNTVPCGIAGHDMAGKLTGMMPEKAGTRP